MALTSLAFCKDQDCTAKQISEPFRMAQNLIKISDTQASRSWQTSTMSLPILVSTSCWPIHQALGRIFQPHP